MHPIQHLAPAFVENDREDRNRPGRALRAFLAGQLVEAERKLLGEVDAQEGYALRFNGTTINPWPTNN